MKFLAAGLLSGGKTSVPLVSFGRTSPEQLKKSWAALHYLFIFSFLILPMSTKIVAAAALLVLFSLGLAFQGAPEPTILLCAGSIVLGFAFPDLDRFLFPLWKQLRVVVLLMAGLVFAYVFLMAPTACYYFNFPHCVLFLRVLLGLLVALIFAFDFLNPSRAPFHTMVALLFSVFAYSIFLTYMGQVENTVVATGAFASAYALHYLLESANVDRSHI